MAMPPLAWLYPLCDRHGLVSSYVVCTSTPASKAGVMHDLLSCSMVTLRGNVAFIICDKAYSCIPLNGFQSLSMIPPPAFAGGACQTTAGIHDIIINHIYTFASMFAHQGPKPFAAQCNKTKKHSSNLLSCCKIGEIGHTLWKAKPRKASIALMTANL